MYQDTYYTTSYSTDSIDPAAAGALFGAALFPSLIVTALAIVSMWKIFKKAGVAGWKSIVPFYNMYVLCEICGYKGIYFLLSFIPVFNILIVVLTDLSLARKFGKSTGFGVLMIFFSIICMPILAFGDAKYNAAVGHQQSDGFFDKVGEDGSAAPASDAAGQTGTSTPAGA